MEPPVGLEKFAFDANNMFGLEDVLYTYAASTGYHQPATSVAYRRATYTADTNYISPHAETVAPESTTILAVHMLDFLKAMPPHVLDQTLRQHGYHLPKRHREKHLAS